MNRRIVATRILSTTGVAEKLRLIADRPVIRADRNDLAYVTVEAVDKAGVRVPDADAEVHFTVSGPGELMAVGNGNPKDPSSFQQPVRALFRGRCLAILRPNGKPGAITLRAEADGLAATVVAVKVSK